MTFGPFAHPTAEERRETQARADLKRLQELSERINPTHEELEAAARLRKALGYIDMERRLQLRDAMKLLDVEGLTRSDGVY